MTQRKGMLAFVLVAAQCLALSFLPIHSNDFATQLWQRFSNKIKQNLHAKVLANGLEPNAWLTADPCQGSDLGGLVWLDYDADGVKDANEKFGVDGVEIKVFDCNGNLAASDVSDVDGNWYVDPTGVSFPVRVEFSNLPEWASEAFVGTNSLTSVQTLSSASCSVNFAVDNAADYCGSTNPTMVVACYESGNAYYGSNGNTNKGIVSFAYNSSGTNASGVGTVAQIYQVGTVWGMAWQAKTKRMFASTLLKRHSGLGEEGVGGVYVMDFSSGTGSVSTSFDLQGVSPSNGGAAIDLGSITRTGGSDYTLPNSNTTDNVDLDAFGKIGKVGFGDADMSPDDSTLWLVNLNQRALITVDVTSTASYPGTVKQYLLSDATGLPTCSNGVLRPWGLAFEKGKGYLGCVCTAENSGTSANMHAYVLSFDPANPTVFTTEVDFALDYTREKAVDFPSYGLNIAGAWHPWVSTWAGTGYSNSPGSEVGYPQPIVSDIDFLDDGSMVIGLADRFGFQMGRANYLPVSGNTSSVSGDVAGDIIKACWVNGEWTLEGGTGCSDNDTGSNSSSTVDGPSNSGEFFYQDYFDDTAVSPTYNHNETFVGSVGVLKGSNEVAAVHYDPINGANFAWDLGIIWHNQTTGARTDQFRIVDSGPAESKGNGLGDVDMTCAAAPIQIGNTVWVDTDKDGTQDPCETGLNDLNVKLYKMDGGTTTLIATTTTATRNGVPGTWYFADYQQFGSGYDTLTPGKMYFVTLGEGGQFNPATDALTIGGSTYQLATQNSGEGTQPDLNDSDASIVSDASKPFDGYPALSVTIGQAGFVDHSLDFGLTEPSKPYIGDNQVVCHEETAVFVANPDISTPTDSITGTWTVMVQAGSTATPSSSMSDSVLAVVFTNSTNSSIIDAVIFTAPNGLSDTALVTVYPTSVGAVNHIGCSGDGYSVTVNGHVYNELNPSGTEVLTNHFGCDSTVTINLYYDSFVVNGSVTNASTVGGSNGDIDLTVLGNSAPFTYDWSNDGPETPDNDTEDLSGISAGNYTVTVTASTGCTQTATFEVMQPTCDLTLQATTVSASCFGATDGSIDLAVTGTGSPYTFDWSNDGPETPDNDTQDLSGLASGSYTVTVTNSFGCTATLTKEINQPTILQIAGTATNVTTLGGSDGQISITVSGGTSPYTYDWSNDGPDTPDNDPEDLTNLSSGSYTVTVSDAHNCTQTASYQVSEPNCDLQLQATTVSVTCFGEADGSIDLVVTGTGSPYTYDWSNDGPETPDNDTQDLSGLASGSYTVTVTNSFGCTATLTKEINQPTILQIAGTVTNVTTLGGSNGQINIMASGGTSPYTYDWSNDGPDTPDNDPEDLTNLASGNYTVTVSDAHNCTQTASYQVSEPSCDLTLESTKTNATCFGAADGSIDLTVTGTGSPYTYDWSNDGADVPDNDPQDLSGLPAGSYTVTVTNSFGCSATLTKQVGQPSEVQISGTVTNVSSSGGNDGFIDITAGGGTAPLTFDWSNDGPETPDNDGEDIFDLTAGNYTVTVTDAHGCTNSESFTVSEPLTFDLALRKALATGQSATVLPGSNVTYTITVFNQGQVGATNILVIDYLPANLSFSGAGNAGWVNFGAGPTWLIPSLAPGASISKNIILKVGNNAPNGPINNFAEISAADDNDPGTSEPPTDLDSSPNAYQFDDAGGAPGTASDNAINGNGTGAPGSSNPDTDEDDHDGEQVEVYLPILSLGNLIFHDVENDGIFNNVDQGIEGVEVLLYDAGADHESGTSDDAFVASTTTNAAGQYLFELTEAGYYFVKLNGTGIPGGYVSSTGDGIYDNDGAGAYEPATGPDNDVDNVDDGTTDGNMILSDVIHLDFGTEPNGDDNFTLDFGLFEPQPLPTLSLGDQVFIDENNDGIINNADYGVEDVEVELYDAGADHEAGTADDQFLDAQTTNGFGNYQFTGLPEGFYFVKLNGNGISAGYISSTGGGVFDNDGAGTYEPAADPDNNLDNMDDGTQMGSMIVTGVIELTFNEEPDGNVNPTVDFGLYAPQTPTLSLGNLVFHDYENDGVFNSMDAGIGDVEVELYDAGADHNAGTSDDQLLEIQTTNGFGEYLFSGLPAGFYFVKLNGNGLPANHVSSTGDGIYDNDGSGAYEPAADPDNDLDGNDDGSQMGNMILSGVIELTTYGEPNVHENPTVDFGIYEPQTAPTVSLGNLVFADLENDGVFNNADYGLEDVEVQLYDAGGDHESGTYDDQLLDSQTTNGFGFYLFTGLPEGFYFVKITGAGLPVNHVSSTGDGIYDQDGSGAFEPATGADNNQDDVDDGTQMGQMVITEAVELTLGDEPNGDVNLTLDFGFYEPQTPPTLTLGNLVFLDQNNDGVFNNADTGVEDVEVQIYDAGADQTAGTGDDQFVETQNTNGFGEYQFTGLQEGFYFVKLTGNGIPVGHVSSTGDGILDNDASGAFEPAADPDNDVNNTDDGTQMAAMIQSGVIYLTLGDEPDGDVNQTVDFGIYDPKQPASLGNFVWYDLDHDGQQDPTETGVSNIGVTLMSTGPDGVKGGADDSVFATQTTNGDGIYFFQNILPDSYYVVFDLTDLPANYYPTDQNIGNPATNSDADGMGMTGVILLGEGQVNVDIDFGVEPETATIGNFVWQDFDGDGSQDGGEPGVSGVHVYLLDLGADGMKGNDDNQLADATTNSNGEYSFTGINPGAYYLVFDPTTLPQSFTATTKDSGSDSSDSDANAMGMTDAFDISAGEVDNSFDFGVISTSFDLALTKTLSPGQSSQVDVGDIISYTISITNQGANPAYQISVIDHLPNGLVLAAGNAGWTSIDQHTAEYIIAGPVQPGQTTSIEIKTIVLYASSGQTLLNMAEVGSVEDINGDVVTDVDSTPDNNEPNEDDTDETGITLVPHDPTGWIYCDKTGKIIKGGTISVVGPNGIPNSQVFIIHDGIDGYYEFFTDGTPGTYTISYTHPNGYPLSSNCSALVGPFDPTGLPDPVVFGVDTLNAMYISDNSCASNPYYLSFTIEPGDPNIHLNNLPVSCTFIGSVVCEDTNLNDVADAGDIPQVGATIYLYNCADLTTPIASTTSDATGNYRFDGMLPGDYVVGYDAAAGYRFVSTGNINPTGFSDCITLAWGECDTTKTICLYPCPTMNVGPDIDHCSNVNTTQLDANLSHGTGGFTWTPAAGLNDPTIENPVASPASSTTYIVDFDDTFGCTDSDTITVNVGTSTPYLVNMPATDLTAQCAPLPQDDPVFADDCDANLTIVADTVTFAIPCGYSQEITWIATNDEGNSASFTQTLHVEDTQPPSLMASHIFFGPILHGDTLYADCSMIPSLDSIGFASFDNCSATTVNFTENITNGYCPTDGFYQFRHCGWTATDACGNVDSLFFNVVIYDNEAPVLAPAPANVTVSCSAIPNPPILNATDNCDDMPTVTVNDVPTVDFNGCISQIIRTWTAEDDCGNTSSASQTITVFDNTAPTFAGVPASVSLNCTAAVPAPPVVTASDACDLDVPVTFSQTVTVGSSMTGCYTLVRNWTATDNCGNTAVASQTITVFDNTPPTLAGVPANANYDCSTAVPGAAVVTASDACDSNVPVIFGEVINGNATSGCFSIVRTWTATDDCGNSVSASQTITVTDNTAPTLSGVPADLTLACELTVPVAANVTASDACDANVPVVYNQNITGDPTTGCYEITRTWTATDDCGNTSIASQTITVEDDNAPVLSAQPADLALTCMDDVPVAPTITATDNCDNNAPVVFFETPIGAPGCNYQLLRTWAAADDCGNTVIWTQTISVNDNVPPALGGVPANASISCTAPVPAPPTVTATDNCDNNVTVTLTTNYIGDPTSGCYLIERIWTATDDCGNTDTAQQDIAVTDNQPPTLVGVPANGAANCDVIPGENVSATDNCDTNVPVVISDEIVSSPLGCVTQIKRTWTATDDCGNTRIATRTFTVSNTQAPTISVIAPGFETLQHGDTLTLECNQLVGLNAAGAVASADCCGAATMTFHESVAAYNCQTTGYLSIMHCGWIATDCCGNTDSLFFTVVLIDNTPPNLYGMPADEILPVGSPVPAVPIVSALDNCDHSLPISYNSTTTGPANDQTITRTWSVTDDCGNIASATQTILITNDLIAPILANVPPDITIEGPFADSPSNNNYGVTATDNLDSDPDLVFEEQRTGGQCCYTITRTWTATDNFGNSSTAKQIINVTDSQAPVIAGTVADVTGTCGLGAVPIPQLTATDNCTAALIATFSADTTYTACGFHVLRTWTFTDECGNSAIASQNITAEDSEPPVFNPNDAISLSYLASQNANQNGGVSLSIGNKIAANQTWSIGNQTMPSLLGIASDNCAAPDQIGFEVSNILTIISGCQRIYNVNFKVLDACGNVANGEFVVTASFEDDVKPSFASLPQDLSVTCGNVPAAPVLTASDNSGAVTLDFDEVETPGCPRLITRTWTATDACGNAAIAQQTISIVDDQAPVLVNVPANVLATCGNIPTVPTNITASDNCGTLPVNFTETINGHPNCQYTIVRTWTAADACGNSAIRQQYIWVADHIAPTIANLPSVELTVNCDAGVPAAPSLTVSDNCDNSPTVDLVETIQTGSGTCSYTLLRQWTVTDDCGNSTIAQQTIHVVDNTLPVLAGIPADITVSCGNLPTAPTVTASDNCDSNVEILFKETPVTAGSGCQLSITRTWLATDDCGNQTEATQTINVVDNVPPVLSAAPANLSVECGADVPTAATLIATDNCGQIAPVTMQETVVGTGCNRTINRTWTATDACGNTTSATQTIQVSDTEFPAIAGVPADLTLNCGDQIPAAALVTASDNCTSNVQLDFDEETTVTACVQQVLRTWTATDDCGNTSNATQLISFIDQIAPVANEPADLTVDCGGLPPAITPVFTDNCDQQLSVQFTEIATNLACGQNVLRTWTATDDCGNTKTVDQIIHIIDQTPPVLSFENPALAGLSDGDTLQLDCSNGLIFSSSDVLATDACSSVNVQMDMSSFQYGNCLADGYVVLAKFNWGAVDACGNYTSLTLNVRLTDNQAPVVPAMPDLVVNCGQTPPNFPAPDVTDDCSDATLSLSTQNYSTAYGYNLVGTWTAVDNCGNAATTSQTMQVYNIGAAQLVGVPADLTVDLAAGETVPSAANVTAVDNCSGSALTIVFDEDSAQTGPCSSTIERRWSTVGQNGVTVMETQTITVIDHVDFTASVSIDSCNTANGSVSLTPSNFDFAWSDGSTGAVNTGLAAGNYIVTATNSNGCSAIQTITVGAACNCAPATVKEVKMNAAACGTNKGKAVIVLVQPNVADYNFAWSPNYGVSNTAGNARNQLPAGHYDVTISMNSLANCQTVVSFDLEDDCPDCSGIFGLEQQTAAPTAGPTEVCLPVPFGQVSGYEILVDAQVFTGALEACDPHQAVVYSNANLPTGSKYSVSWLHDGATFHTLGNNLSEIVEAMNFVDVNGHWFVDGVAKQLVSTRTSGNYGALEIKVLPSGVTQTLSSVQTTTSVGTLITLPAGQHTVSVTNTVTGCADEIAVNITSINNEHWLQGETTPKEVSEKQEVVISNHFSPNGDGSNDYFTITGLGQVPDYNLKVYDVLGRMVFQTKHYLNNWGGAWGQNNLPSGTYFYLLEDGKGGKRSGYVQIIR